MERIDIESILKIGSAIALLIITLNDKVRKFLLEKLNFRKNKAEIKKDTGEANDEMLEKLMARINNLSEEFIRLSESNTETQKENFGLKGEIQKIEYEKRKLETLISQRCTKMCTGNEK